MTPKTRTAHVVVDGSNIATEGRSMPSLAQLNDAVLAFLEERPGTTVTVVVDATFGHRIDKSEVKEFDAAVANNELVAPPAGAVGRGDAFVLSIANKAGATVLSNDSFQEFHGEYEWLFEEGRLIGGKPVPHVGWVFVPRVPVRGPVSRKSVRESRREPSKGEARRSSTRATASAARRASKEASQPLPVPSTPPPGRAHVAASDSVNDLVPFLEFVEHHPVGTSVNAVVESYSSHGAYVRLDGVLGYVPLRLMADPAPRSAREVMRVGDAVTLVVVSFAPARRSIDLAVPHMAGATPGQPPGDVVTAVGEDATPPRSAAGRGRRGRAKEAAPVADVAPAEVAAPEPRHEAEEAAPAPAKRTRSRRAPAEAAPTTAEAPAPAKKAAASKAAARKATAKQDAAKGGAPVTPPPAEVPPAAAAPSKRSRAKKSEATEATDVTAPAAKSAATRATATKAAATKSAAAKSAATTTTAATGSAKKSAASKAATSTSTAATAPAKKSAAKKSAAKKSAAKKSAAPEAGR